MRKIIPVVAVGVTALALAGGSVGYAATTKDVTVSVDGAATSVSTRAATVAEVLDSQGITVGKHDVVAPAVDAEVADGTQVAVKYGRPVTVKVDGKAKTAWTTATRVDQALAALDVDASGAALSTGRATAVPRSGLALDVATPKTVTVDAAGQKKQLTTTGQTVADVLKVAKITVDADDKLSARPTTPLADGASLTYTRVSESKATTKKKVSYDTVYKRTSKLKKGATKVDRSGESGERTLTYREVRHNGKLKTRTKVGSAVTDKPQAKVVLVGTKVVEVKKAAAKREERSSSSSSRSSSSSKSSSSRSSSKTRKSSSDNAPRVSSGGVWDRLAKCESGGNWSINTGNGYYGGLQFTKSTWRAYGGTGSPHNASRARQIAVAKKVQRGQGWGAWPGCTSKLGIR